MTAQEKKTIYNLLKTVSSWTQSYPSEDFKEELYFEDDIILENNIKNNSVNVADPKEEGTFLSPKPMTLETVKSRIEKCHSCSLCQERHYCVPGEGVENPLVMVIGEGPGEEEDLSGRPFVGKAGQLLDKMLNAIYLDRKKNCYITNIVKCRPPHNRAPMQDEAASCSIFLSTQIRILKPKSILALGRTAVQNLLKTENGINALRGKIFDYNGIPLLATYHPSALLRDEGLKKLAWSDLKIFAGHLKNLYPDYMK